MEMDIPIHGEFHLGLVIWNRAMDFLQLHTELGIHVPTKRGAEQTGAEIIHPILRVPKHDCKILWYIIQQYMQRMHIPDNSFIPKNPILKYMTFRFRMSEGEELWIASAVELQCVFHHLFAAEFAAGEVVQDEFAVFFEEDFAVGDAFFVGAYEFEPPVGFHSVQGC